MNLRGLDVCCSSVNLTADDKMLSHELGVSQEKSINNQSMAYRDALCGGGEHLRYCMQQVFNYQCTPLQALEYLICLHLVTTLVSELAARFVGSFRFLCIWLFSIVFYVNLRRMIYDHHFFPVALEHHPHFHDQDWYAFTT